VPDDEHLRLIPGPGTCRETDGFRIDP
jgi:hypothetical protein